MQKNLFSALLTVLPFLIVLALWWTMTYFMDVPAYVFPSPVKVISDMFSPRWKWPTHILQTIAEAFLGFGAAVVVGMVLALIISWNDKLYKTCMPLLVFVNALPKIALAPLILLWFGYGLLPTSGVAFVIAFFPILVNTARGLSDVPINMVELALSYRTPKWKRFWKINLPYSIPFIMTGCKLASQMAVTGAIVGEFIAAEKGLAALIMQAQAYVLTSVIFASVFYIAIFALLLYFSLELFEKIVFPWAKGGIT